MNNFNIWLRNIQMQYSAEQTYIAQRMLQEQGGWQSHLDRTKGYITSTIEKIQPETVRVLGSGWLFDVPVEYLCNQCKRVILSDIFHPRQVVKKYSTNSKISFKTTDLSGGAVDLAYNHRGTSINLIHSIKSIQPIEYADDLVISVNLLSQLSIFITDFLRRKKKVAQYQLQEIAYAIQQNHLNGLPKNKSILITDHEEEFLDEKGKVVGINPTVFIPIPRNTSTEEWDWQFDSNMTYREDCKTNLKVIATTI